jgi:hypothetical protein
MVTVGVRINDGEPVMTAGPQNGDSPTPRWKVALRLSRLWYSLDEVKGASDGRAVHVDGHCWARPFQGLVFLSLLIPALPAAAQLRDFGFPVTNNDIYSMAVAGNTLYLSGTFTAIGPATGGGSVLDNVTGGVPGGSSRFVDGRVDVCIPDGSGGFFIGGRFNSVGGQPRTSLARVRADLSLDPWSPSVVLFNGVEEIDALAFSGSTLYVAGGFGSLGGQPRVRLGAVDVGTGLATAWDPQPDDRVEALAISAGGDVLVGGYFTQIGGASRNRLAALDASSGAATAWNPSLDGDADAIAATPTAIYIGGGFHQVGVDTRNFIAAVDPGSGAATAWDPDADNYVSTIATSGSTVYVGGTFQSIRGQSRNSVAAIDAATGLPTAWNPAAFPNDAGSVSSIATDGATVYVGGQFLQLGGQARAGLAAVDAVSGSVTAWNPSPDDAYTLAVGVSGSLVYAGGDFAAIGMVKRQGFAAIDIPSRQVLPWDPQSNSQGGQIAVSGSTVYLSGFFTMVGGQRRNGLAAVDATTAQVTAWDPGLFISGPSGLQPPLLWAMRATPSAVYISGHFYTGTTASHVAALGPVNAQVLWRNDLDNFAYGLTLDDTTVYAGGAFSQVNSTPRTRLVALNSADGQIRMWNPGANGDVYSLARLGTDLFVGGQFSQIGVGNDYRYGFAALDTRTGSATALNQGADNLVATIAVDGYNVYLGGSFQHVAGWPRPEVAAVDFVSGQVAPWSSDFGTGAPSCMAADGSHVFVGGNFSTVSGLTCPHLVSLAGLPVTSSVPLPASAAFGLRAMSNPVANGLTVALELRDAARVRLEVLDVSGRRHVYRDLGLLAPGQHFLPLAARGELPRGLYFVRARHGTESTTIRVSVIR